MLSRSTIIPLILLCEQILLAGFIPGSTLGPPHLAWLFQDRLVAQIYEAARQPWSFGFRRCLDGSVGEDTASNGQHPPRTRGNWRG